MTTKKLCMVALAIVINIVGGQIALMFRLPIYLDCIGTIFIAALYGPIYGALPNLLSGLILGMTSDIYSLYYAPVGIVLGVFAGLIWKTKNDKAYWPFLGALLITIPASLISSMITTYLFGGITSSGSTYLVQILAKTPLGLTLSCFIVQLLTDYLDKLIALVLVVLLIKKLPKSLINKVK